MVARQRMLSFRKMGHHGISFFASPSFPEFSQSEAYINIRMIRLRDFSHVSTSKGFRVRVSKDLTDAQDDGGTASVTPRETMQKRVQRPIQGYKRRDVEMLNIR